MTAADYFPAPRPPAKLQTDSRTPTNMASEGATPRGGGGRRPAAATLLMSSVNAFSLSSCSSSSFSSSCTVTGDQAEQTMKEGYGGAAPATPPAGDGGEEKEEEGPVVFLCVRCSIPLGDSLSWGGSDEENHIHLTRRSRPTPH